MVTALNISFPPRQPLRDGYIYNSGSQSRAFKAEKNLQIFDSTQTLSQLISPFSSSAFVGVMLISGTSCCSAWLEWKPADSQALMGRFWKVTYSIQGSRHRHAEMLLSKKEEGALVSAEENNSRVIAFPYLWWLWPMHSQRSMGQLQINVSHLCVCSASRSMPFSHTCFCIDVDLVRMLVALDLQFGWIMTASWLVNL